MSLGTLTFSRTLVAQECASCGMTFAVPQDFDSRRRDDHGNFFCPSGHSQRYSGKSELEKAREELVRERARLDQACAEANYQRARAERGDRQIRARKAVATRLRNRLKSGRCPCCSHEFKDLKRHMRTEHPKWNPERAVDALARLAIAHERGERALEIAS